VAKYRGKGSIWSNAFKSGGVIEGTTLKNGTRSRVALSSINTTGVATIAYSFTAAIMAIIQQRVSAARLTDGTFWLECKSSRIPTRKYILRYNAAEKALQAAVQENGEPIAYELANESFAHWSIFVPRVVQLITESPTGEFANNFKEVLRQYRGEGAITRAHEMYVLNDYLYESQHEYIQHNEEVKYVLHDFHTLRIDTDYTPMLNGRIGEFKINEVEKEAAPSKSKSRSKTSKKKKVTTGYDRYHLEWDRELTEAEKMLIPNLDFEIFKVPEIIEELAYIIKEEIDSIKPVRNLLLYGDAGTGKSTSAVILAQLLGLPYRFTNCSLNTEESEFFGTYKPNDKGGFELSKPPFAETFEKGGVIEIQEPSILKSGVAVKFNSALDDTNMIILPDDTVVPRHKNCIVVITTNIDYAGCSEMNEAVRDRFSYKIQMELPDTSDLIKMAMEQSRNSDATLVRKLVDAVQKIALKIEEEQIGGSCSTRGLIDWARDIKYTKDPIRSARRTLLAGVSFEKEIQEEIVDTILKPMF
jgi:MoxR-like ATPase